MRIAPVDVGPLSLNQITEQLVVEKTNIYDLKDEVGLSELRFESNEPKFKSDDEEEADMTLEGFLEMFPEGWYKFFGSTVEGAFI